MKNDKKKNSNNEQYIESQSIFSIDDDDNVDVEVNSKISYSINNSINNSGGGERIGCVTVVDGGSSTVVLEGEENNGDEDKDCSVNQYKFYHINDKNIDRNKQFPRSIKYLISTEICERYTFYSIRSVMVLYLINFYHYSDNHATSALHTFGFISYFIPILLGAYLADGVIGKYRTILLFCFVNTFGCIFLLMSSSPKLVGSDSDSRTQWLLAIGLLLFATGTGGMKPVALTFCGDQLNAKKQAPLIERLYTWFYLSINIGCFCGTILSPLCRTYLGYEITFVIPCLFMCAATASLILGSKHYKKRPITGSILATSFGIIGRGIWERFLTLIGRVSHGESHYNGHWLDRSKSTYDSHAVESVKACLNVLMCFIPIPFQRALGELYPSRWTLQALSMNRDIGIFKIQPDQIQVLNPLIILFIVPLSEVILFGPLRNRGMGLTPLKKMSIGMFTSVIGFLVCVALQIHIDNSPPQSVSILLQIPQYFIMAIAEMFITSPGFEFAYGQSPSSHKSLIMSGWLICISLGNLFIVLVVDGVKLSVQWHEYLFFSGCTLFFSFVFVFIAYRFKPSDPSIVNYHGDELEVGDEEEDEVYDDEGNGIEMKEKLSDSTTSFSSTTTLTSSSISENADSTDYSAIRNNNNNDSYILLNHDS